MARPSIRKVNRKLCMSEHTLRASAWGDGRDVALEFLGEMQMLLLKYSPGKPGPESTWDMNDTYADVAVAAIRHYTDDVRDVVTWEFLAGFFSFLISYLRGEHLPLPTDPPPIECRHESPSHGDPCGEADHIC